MGYQQTLDLIRGSSSLLSLIGSCFICARLAPEKPWLRPHVRACLALLLAVADLMFSLTQVGSCADLSLEYRSISLCWLSAAG